MRIRQDLQRLTSTHSVWIDRKRPEESGRLQRDEGRFVTRLSIPILGIANISLAPLAVIHFSKSLAVEWKDFARVNTVSPGFIDTNMGAGGAVRETALSMAALGRTGDPRELKGVRILAIRSWTCV
jgi:NAD(P)-dependent dehydrogenase (short-subunit alcohol dehydrogenase family)